MTLVPMHASDACPLLLLIKTEDRHAVRIDALIVIDVNLALQGAEQDQLPVRRPFHQGELQALQLFAPKALPVHRSNNDGTILIDYADFLSVGRPLHISYDGTIAIIDNLLEPNAAVQHPHDNKPVLVGSCKLAEIVVPCYHHDV